MPSGIQLLDGNLYNKYAVGGVSLLVDADISQFMLRYLHYHYSFVRSPFQSTMN
ncbi:hypothetical protein Q5692_29335 [Microcoleus sp. C2C3]|uniref:hypothetical protein n=1 Tax=unclassified Microcoleus TaxID=2642155 RepID=UPI002FD14CE9